MIAHDFFLFQQSTCFLSVNFQLKRNLIVTHYFNQFRKTKRLLSITYCFEFTDFWKQRIKTKKIDLFLYMFKLKLVYCTFIQHVIYYLLLTTRRKCSAIQRKSEALPYIYIISKCTEHVSKNIITVCKIRKYMTSTLSWDKQTRKHG